MNNELFTVKPSLTQHYGRTVTKEMEFDETTEINKEWEYDGIKSTLKSTQTEELKEGTILIWSEEMGYIIPNVPMYKLKDLEEEIKEIKNIYKDNTDINP